MKKLVVHALLAVSLLLPLAANPQCDDPGSTKWGKGGTYCHKHPRAFGC